LVHFSSVVEPLNARARKRLTPLTVLKCRAACQARCTQPGTGSAGMLRAQQSNPLKHRCVSFKPLIGNVYYRLIKDWPTQAARLNGALRNAHSGESSTDLSTLLVDKQKTPSRAAACSILLTVS